MTRTPTRSIPETAINAAPEATGGKRPFEEPRLAFIEPRLTPRGDLRKVTAGAFGTVSP